MRARLSFAAGLVLVVLSLVVGGIAGLVLIALALLCAFDGATRLWVRAGGTGNLTSGRQYRPPGRRAAAMRPNRSCPPSRVVPVLVYPDVRAAVAFLETAFGFRERVRIGEDHRAQMGFGPD